MMFSAAPLANDAANTKLRQRRMELQGPRRSVVAAGADMLPAARYQGKSPALGKGIRPAAPRAPTSAARRRRRSEAHGRKAAKRAPKQDDPPPPIIARDAGTRESIAALREGLPDAESTRGQTWSEEEHSLFLLGMECFGKGDWKNISRYFVLSRTSTQIASHAQKFFGLRNKKRKRHPGTQVLNIIVPQIKSYLPPYMQTTSVFSHAPNPNRHVSVPNFMQIGHSAGGRLLPTLPYHQTTSMPAAGSYLHGSTSAYNAAAGPQGQYQPAPAAAAANYMNAAAARSGVYGRSTSFNAAYAALQTLMSFQPPSYGHVNAPTGFSSTAGVNAPLNFNTSTADQSNIVGLRRVDCNMVGAAGAVHAPTMDFNSSSVSSDIRARQTTTHNMATGARMGRFCAADHIGEHAPMLELKFSSAAKVCVDPAPPTTGVNISAEASDDAGNGAAHGAAGNQTDRMQYRYDEVAAPDAPADTAMISSGSSVHVQMITQADDAPTETSYESVVDGADALADDHKLQVSSESCDTQLCGEAPVDLGADVDAFMDDNAALDTDAFIDYNILGQADIYEDLGCMF